MKSEQSFLVKIWLAPLPSIRTWVQYQGISSSFLSCIAINKGELLFPVTFLTDCLLVELTFGQAEREKKMSRLQPASVWRNDGGKLMDECWVEKDLGVRERTTMPLLWLFPDLPFPAHDLLSHSLPETSWWVINSGVGR